MLPRSYYPAKTNHAGSCGGANWLRTSSVQTETVSPDLLYGMPFSPLRPQDTFFNPACGPGVPAWWTESGHLVVRPMINDKSAGFMLLDTGTTPCCKFQNFRGVLWLQWNWVRFLSVVGLGLSLS